MINSITDWWGALDSIQQTYVILIFMGGLLFLIQIIFSFFGGELGDGTDVGVANDFGVSDYSFKFFSLQTVSSFLLIGGLVGLYVAHKTDGNHLISTPCAIVSGLAMAYLVNFVIKKMLSLQTSGNLNYKKAIGLSGKVYLKIPVGGEGQIEFDFNNRRLYCKAISKNSQELYTGTRIKIVAVTSDSVFVVENDLIK